MISTPKYLSGNRLLKRRFPLLNKKKLKFKKKIPKWKSSLEEINDFLKKNLKI